MPAESVSSVVSNDDRQNTAARFPHLRLPEGSPIAAYRLLREIGDAFKSAWQRLTTRSCTNESGGLEEELRGLSRRLVSAHEEEGIRLARELHDDVAQRVAVLAAELSALARESDELPAGISNRIVTLSDDVAALGGDIHRLSHHLHPVILQHIGLGPAIRVFCRELSETRQVKIDVRVSQLPALLDKDIALCLYRIAQEALHNVVRHSGVSSAVVALATIKHDIVLKVVDCGVGFDPCEANVRPSVGLTSMRERVRLVNGQFSLWSKKGEGTRIEVRVPRHAGM